MTETCNLRYKTQHMGDSFVELIESVIGSAVDSAANTVDSLQMVRIKSQQKKKIMEIGTHSVRIRKDHPDLFEDDDEIQVVFNGYDELQDAIDQFVLKREERAQRTKDRFSNTFGCAEGSKNIKETDDAVQNQNMKTASDKAEETVSDIGGFDDMEPSMA